MCREIASGDRRVALPPESVPRVRTLGLDVLVETGAGERLRLTDDEYRAAGAGIGSRDEVIAYSDIVVALRHASRDVCFDVARRWLPCRPFSEPRRARLSSPKGGLTRDSPSSPWTSSATPKPRARHSTPLPRWSSRRATRPLCSRRGGH
ncbi:hypothetical protein [Streptomyces olivaceus]|uniref:hypothetical protein n=1 Tax=Streptomyces olivaceus TaxID=47716 RepID=UPI0033AB0C52